MGCMICGRKKTTLYTIKHEEKKFSLCSGCKEKFDGKNRPVVWVGEEDLLSRYEGDEDTLKEIRSLEPGDYKDLADMMADWFWNSQSMGDWFSDSLCDAFEQLSKDKEEQRLKEMPKEELPLMVGNVKHKENETIISRRLKGDA